jgi:pimeloyl-ACP methyl ester carboxylesterase
MKILFVIALAFTSLPAVANDCVVVLMHGKWGGPKSPYLRVIAEKIRYVCDVELREMPWSRNRNYDETYEVALEKLSETVTRHRAKGYKTIFLGGHSFGANAAIAYQACYGGVDGVIALAPGHSPYEMYQMGLNRSMIDLSKRHIDEGQPQTLLEFTDLNQGQRKTFSSRADIFFSYFNPDGLGNMALSASRFKASVPFLWVIGTQDWLFQQGSAYAFDNAPENRLSKYVVVEANHAATPEVGADVVVQWIKSVTR